MGQSVSNPFTAVRERMSKIVRSSQPADPPSTPPSTADSTPRRDAEARGPSSKPDMDLFAEIVSSGDGPTAGLPPLKILLNEQISSSAVETLRDSKLVAQQLAKTIVMDALADAHNQGKFGEFLQYAFAYESILYPTRWLVHWSIHTDNSVANSRVFLKEQLLHWLQDTDRTYGPQKQLVDLCDWWLREERSRVEAVDPLLVWTLRQKDSVKDPLAATVCAALAYARVCVQPH